MFYNNSILLVQQILLFLLYCSIEIQRFWASLVVQMVKNLSAVQEAWVWSLGQEDPLEKEMTTSSSIFTWRISWTEEPEGTAARGGHKESDTTEQLTFLLSHTGDLPDPAISQVSCIPRKFSH